MTMPQKVRSRKQKILTTPLAFSRSILAARLQPRILPANIVAQCFRLHLISSVPTCGGGLHRHSVHHLCRHSADAEKKGPAQQAPGFASLSRQRAVEREMQNVLVELSELTRQVSAQLDSDRRNSNC